MFWGVALENGKRYSQVVETTYHVSMAALEPANKEVPKANKFVSLMLEHSKTEFLLCTLEYDRVMQVNLDLNFVEGEEVTFYVNGEGTIHLTGYIISDEGDVESDESDEEVSVKTNKPAAAKSPGTSKGKTGGDDDDEDEEDDDEDWVPPENDTVKRKKENGEQTPESLKSKKPKIAPKSSTKSEQNSKSDKSKSGKKDATIMLENEDDEDEDSEMEGSDLEKIESDSGDEESYKEEEESDSSNEEDEEWASDNEEEGEDKKENGGWGKTWGSKGKPAKQAGKSPVAKAAKAEKGTPKRQKIVGDAFTTKSPASATKKSPDSPFTKLAGGVQSKDVVQGKGPVATPGKKLHVYYTGRLVSNNKEFDSRTKGAPFTFKLGQGEVIKGWDVALKGMKVGGKRKIIVPPAMGYGNKSMGPIPANSSLQFDIELKAVSK